MTSDLSTQTATRTVQNGTLAWPEMYDRLKELRMTVFTAEPGLQLNLMVSIAARPLAVGTARLMGPTASRTSASQ